MRKRVKQAVVTTAVAAMGMAVPAVLGGAQASAAPLSNQGSSVSANPVTGGLDLFQTQVDGTIMYAAYQARGGWQPWKSLGGKFQGTVSALSVTFPTTALNAFATAANGNLEENSYTRAGAWTGWKNLGGTLASSPAVLFEPGTNNIGVFGTDTKGNLVLDTWRARGGWTGWQILASQVTGTPSAIVDPASGNIEVYVTGTAGKIMQVAYNNGFVGAQRSLGLAGATASPSAIYDFHLGEPEVFFVRNGGLAELSWSRRGGWTETSLGGSFKDSPAALFDQVTSNVEVYAKGTDGTLKQDAHTWAGWTGIRNLGGSEQLGSDPVPFVNTAIPEGLDIFALAGPTAAANQPAELAWSSVTHSWNWWRVVA